MGGLGIVMVLYFVNGDIVAYRSCNSMCTSLLAQQLDTDTDLRLFDKQVEQSF